MDSPSIINDLKSSKPVGREPLGGSLLPPLLPPDPESIPEHSYISILDNDVEQSLQGNIYIVI